MKYLKKVCNRYHNRGGKEKAAKNYRANADLLRYEANMKYKNMSKKEKEKSITTLDIMKYLKQYQKIYDSVKKNKK